MPMKFQQFETIFKPTEIIPPINSNVKNPVDLAEYAMLER